MNRPLPWMIAVTGLTFLMTLGCGNDAAPTPSETVKDAVTQPEAPPASEPGLPVLKSNGATGLLGVPLPAGATLIDRFPGDRAKGQDPRETYEIQATDGQLRAFFMREMPSNGWTLGGNSSDHLLFFEQDNKMVGIMIDKSKNIFMLMGS